MVYRTALLGGSYDPVHRGHVALGEYFANLLQVDQLRVIPTGLPWQKASLKASAQQRADMVALAFAGRPFSVAVDMQEIARGAQGLPTYSIDTLRQIRAELGPQASISFLMGADQLQRLDTWHEWQALFSYAHFCVAARPGYDIATAGLPPVVAEAFSSRLGTPEQIRNTPHGLTYLAQDFAVDISATRIRAALQRGEKADSLIPPLVLDYIEQHNLYKS
ncbi:MULTISPECIES: nicotinate-nucleotide adenylyltransferase [unclassified Duganella]|uniref:nicotinate-nucleotide adenylyltransferase n=1 Tax=unclassified Duganella TaxID=2636909 RepID=UPI00088BCAA1|nr:MULTISPECIES: nicotinate-nucleotide adenylyltransferase [unclassified Duganella]SDF94665.1 nicotinate-nucleotide adenylyltransferase [Duganella sp. OV458]SDJ10055.1 nicotinate-nucleotide adenylyltransferase [Duganella sp. OV510]